MSLPTTLNTLDVAQGGLPFFTQAAKSGINLDTLDVAQAGLPIVSNPLTLSTDYARITQAVVEVLRDADDPGGGNLKVTQGVLEVVVANRDQLYVTQAVLEVLRRSPMQAALGMSWMVFQPDQFFDVWVRNGELNSAASDVAVLNGANLLLVGDEILQFKTVTSLGGSVYRLSYLLRGRFGTEWAMSQHVAGERVVLLTTTGIRRIGYSLSEIDATRYYKAVSYKQSLAEAWARVFVDSGVALKPYAPVRVRGSRDGGNNLTITWIRRTRVTGGWRDYVEVPLGEAIESYEVDVLNPSTGAVVRTLTATTTSVVYSAADQTTDFGAPQASVSVLVYQMSASVGRGHGSPATV